MPRVKQFSYPLTLRNRYGYVKLYHCTKTPWPHFAVIWSVGRKRQRKNFASEQAAHNHAEAVLEQFANGQALAGRMTASQVLYYEACRQKLGDVPLMTAVDFYLNFHGKAQDEATGILLPKVRDLFLADIKAQGNSESDIKSVTYHLNAFCEDHKVPILAVRTADIDTFLQSRDCSNRTRRNMRTSIFRLFEWAKKKGHLPQNLNTAASLSSNYKIERAAAPGIFTPEQMVMILDEVDYSWLPYMAIAGFAGLRQAEIMRLKWGNIRMDEKVIILGADITKTNKRRVAHMHDNLVAWLLLAGVGKPEDSICPTGQPTKEMERICSETGLTWVRNGLRHSFISYEMALVRDAAKVAEQCGNSASEAQASYKANATESEARRWFGILPE